MSKRVGAIICICICICMTISLLEVPQVSADFTEQWTDSFESGSGVILDKDENVTTGVGRYYKSNNGFLIPTNGITHPNNANHISIGSGMGFNGSNGLYVNCNVAANSGNYYGTAVATKSVTHEEGTELILRYKLKLLEMEAPENTSTYFLFLSGVTNGAESPRNKNRAGLIYYGTNYDMEEWYTFVTKVKTEISGDSLTAKTKTYVLNEDNTLKTTATKDITIPITEGKTAATQPIYLWPVSTQQNAKKKSLVLDDVSLTRIKADNTQKISFDPTGSNVYDGQTGIAINKTFRLAFDHELNSTAAKTVALYKKSDTQKTSPISCTILQEEGAFDSFLVTPAALDVNTEYVFDLSGIKSSAGATVSDSSKTISFKTFDPGDAPIEPLALTKVSATGGDFANGTYTGAALEDKFTLTFDQEVLLPTYGTDVKIYKTADDTKTAIGAEVSLSNDMKSLEITPSTKLALNTNYTIDFSGVKSNTGVGVGETKTCTFTTVATRPAFYIEDDLSAAKVGGAEFYENSDILTKPSSTISIADGFGYDASRGFKADNTEGYASVALYTNSYELDESETLYFEFKFKINSMSTETGSNLGYFCINDSGQSNAASRALFKLLKTDEGVVLSDNGQGNKFSYKTGAWYTMLMAVKRDSQQGYIYDDKGALAFDVSRTKAYSDSVKLGITYGSTSTKTAGEVFYDDFKVYRIQNDSLALNNTYSTVYDNMKDAPTTGTHKLVFNQPFGKGMNASVFSLYQGEEKVNATIKRVGGNEIRITPLESLKAGRDYTIKFTEATTLSGTRLEKNEITFTTKKIYDVNALSSSLEASSDGKLASGNVTLTVDNVGNTISDCVVIVAVYGDSRLSKLVGLEMADGKTLLHGENTISVNISKNYEDVSYVEFLIYDKISTLKPLMKGFKVGR